MSGQQIIMRGASYGAENGDRRTVPVETAVELVALGLAAYPPNSAAAKAEPKPRAPRKPRARKVAAPPPSTT